MVKHQLKNADLTAAYAFVGTIPVIGGKPVPADEEAIDALIEEKYRTACTSERCHTVSPR
jgi:hypothetical protein